MSLFTCVDGGHTKSTMSPGLMGVWHALDLFDDCTVNSQEHRAVHGADSHLLNAKQKAPSASHLQQFTVYAGR